MKAVNRTVTMTAKLVQTATTLILDPSKSLTKNSEKSMTDYSLIFFGPR